MSFYAAHCSLLPPLLSWFLFSSLLSIVNKQTFGHLHFPTPLLLTSLHFLVQYAAAFLLTTYPAEKNPAHLPSVSNLPWRTYLRVAVPVGCSSALDIGLSNMAMALVPLSIYTMVKSATPVFVLVLSFAMGLARPSLRLVAVVTLITFGEMLTVKSPQHINEVLANATTTDDTSPEIGGDVAEPGTMECSVHASAASQTENEALFAGILLCLLASFFSAVRWTLLQLQMESLPTSVRTPLQTLRLLSPSMFFSILLASLFLESHKFDLISTCDPRTVLLALSGGVLAVCMMLAEYSLLLQSSAIVLMIGGVMKELLTIFLGVLIFRERVSTQAWVGFAIVTSGVVVYKFDKAKGKAGSEEGERKKDGRGQRIAGTDETEDEDMLELMSWTQGGDEDEDFSN